MASAVAGFPESMSTCSQRGYPLLLWRGLRAPDDLPYPDISADLGRAARAGRAAPHRARARRQGPRRLAEEKLDRKEDRLLRGRGQEGAPHHRGLELQRRRSTSSPARWPRFATARRQCRTSSTRRRPSSTPTSTPEDPAQRLGRSPNALEDRLVEIYKADEPDAITVILESDGYDDALRRTSTSRRSRRRTPTSSGGFASSRRHRGDRRDRPSDPRPIAAKRAELRRTRVELESREAELDAVRDAAKDALARTAHRRGPRGRRQQDRGQDSGAAGRRRSRRQRRRRRSPPADSRRPAAASSGRSTGHRLAVREALGPAPRGHRHRGPRRNADPRCEGGSNVLTRPRPRAAGTATTPASTTAAASPPVTPTSPASPSRPARSSRAT